MNRTALAHDDLPPHIQRWAETYDETVVKQEEENGRTSYAFEGDVSDEVTT
ncbi:hypothetical protein [Natrinema salinisoli]|uniref:hypothetical protein n=1 Tax=Natrinema salinisoli TaxID=2878535 RepID=UPI001CF06D9B|nr:hypothetical protein [Natrinema salinisoli]